jgi:hypothetical protein
MSVSVDVHVQIPPSNIYVIDSRSDAWAYQATNDIPTRPLQSETVVTDRPSGTWAYPTINDIQTHTVSTEVMITLATQDISVLMQPTKPSTLSEVPQDIFAVTGQSALSVLSQYPDLVARVSRSDVIITTSSCLHTVNSGIVV